MRRRSFFALLLLTSTFLLTGCFFKRGNKRGVISRPSSPWQQATTYEPPPEPPAAVAVRVEDQAKDAYDRSFYLRQAEMEGSLVTTRDSVPLKGASSAALLLNMKRGSLSVAGGLTDQLLEAEFEYSIHQPIPIVAYQTKGTSRVIDMLGMGKDNDWKLTVSERIPVAIKAEVGGGVREFNLEDVPITEFSLQAMGGPSVVNFPGDQPYLTSFNITQRQGSISLMADGAFDSLIRASAVTCCGDFAASFAGLYSRLTRLDMGSRRGDVDLDLTGCWLRTCSIRVVATCGNLRLKLPAGLGCSVKVHHSCASICAVGMHRTWSSEAWVNPAYGKTQVFLDIIVESTCGNVDLILDSCCCPPWVW
jgi:hypothetical protein